jgi:hypothetical protein
MLWIATEGTPATAGMPTSAGAQVPSAGTPATAVTVAFNKNLYVENCLRKTPKNHIKIAQTLD